MWLCVWTNWLSYCAFVIDYGFSFYGLYVTPVFWRWINISIQIVLVWTLLFHIKIRLERFELEITGNNFLIRFLELGEGTWVKASLKLLVLLVPRKTRTDLFNSIESVGRTVERTFEVSPSNWIIKWSAIIRHAFIRSLRIGLEIFFLRVLLS